MSVIPPNVITANALIITLLTTGIRGKMNSTKSKISRLRTRQSFLLSVLAEQITITSVTLFLKTVVDCI